MGKRTCDLIASAVGLLFLLPLFAAVALAVVIASGRPVLFRQVRVGRLGRPFALRKFRTMIPDSQRHGCVTTGTDRRVTPIGRILRRFKLDELPQLWNVLVGDMSFVGPRPDVPGYADRLQGEDRGILEVRPGITGPATLFFRDEEALLARATDPRKYNDEVIWPIKVRLNREYVQKQSLWRDMGYILVTLCPPLDRWLRLLPAGIEFSRPGERQG